MSRNIAAGQKRIPDEALKERTNQTGKLIFTKYQGRNCAMLLRGSRILAIQALSEKKNRIGAVYVAKIKNMAQNLDACFVEIAESEICFLPLKNARYPFVCSRKDTFQRDGLREGDELLVQIRTEAQKTKQATVTAHLSLANEIAAVNLGSDRICYSTKLSVEEKERLRGWLTEYLDGESLLPEHAGLVVRTQAGQCSREDFQQALESLLAEFTVLCRSAEHRTCYSCIREAPPAFAAVLDKLAYPYEYQEIVTDQRDLFPSLKAYCEEKLPHKQVRLYEDEQLSLSKLYSLETKCKMAFERSVWLDSGGYLVIEPTEALTVIDVNSGKYEARKGFSESAWTINCEAAKEIALQLRLRNLSGMIIADFINMDRKEDQEKLLSLLRELVRSDKQKVSVVDITPLGLVEITRKKDVKPLREQF